MKLFLRCLVAICILLLSFVSFTYVTEASEVSNQENSDEALETVATADDVEENNLVEEILETANQLVGTKYAYAGNSPSTGFDCSGFTSYVFGQHGISLPRSSSDMYSIGEKVNRHELELGDLVFFNTSGKRISHVGIYIGDNQFIHSSTSHGVIISDLNDPYYWSKRYVGATRIL